MNKLKCLVAGVSYLVFIHGGVASQAFLEDERGHRFKVMVSTKSANGRLEGHHKTSYEDRKRRKKVFVSQKTSSDSPRLNRITPIYYNDTSNKPKIGSYYVLDKRKGDVMPPVIIKGDLTDDNF